MAEKTDIIEESVSENVALDEQSLKEQELQKEQKNINELNALKEKEELIKKIEALDASVLPDKDEILKRIKSEAGKNDSDSKKNKGNSILLPIGLFFQFIFTVMGGGMFISGLIAGFSVKWDTSLQDGIANISIILAIVGGIFFVVGIILAFVLYKAALKRYISSKIK